MSRVLLLSLGLLLGTLPAVAQVQNVRRLEVNVTAVSDRSVYIDHGRESQVEAGDRLLLFPAGRAQVRAVIRSVSRTGARAELTGTVDGMDVGTLGEVWLPEARFVVTAPAKDPEPQPGKPVPRAGKPATAAAAAPEAPEAPKTAEALVWESPPEDWDESLPLLAPAHSPEPEEREVRYHGRVYTGFDYTEDDQYGSTYDVWRSGVDFDVENPFKRGGLVHFDAKYYSRSSEVEDGQDRDDSELLIRRASYRWGGIRNQPSSWEVGRFQHKEFPELGVVDGAEFVRQLDSGSRVGASAGFLPEPTDQFETGDDMATSVFYRYVSDPEETFSFGTAYRKTWHDGAPDRDLLVSTLDYYASRNTSVHATTWIDYYTSSDERKDQSLELTQLQLNARHSTDAGNGAGIFASYLRWPDIERFEFQSLTDEQINNNKVGRVGVNGWLRMSNKHRLSTRLDGWQDQDDSGGSGSLRWSLRDVLYNRGEVSFEVFSSEGKFSDALGGRVYASRRLDRGFINLYWDSTKFEQDNFNGGQEDLLQHRVGFSYDTVALKKWDLSLWSEKRLGDEQDSWSAGVFLQRRF